MKSASAEILREYGPFPDVDAVGGVSFDGQRVWFASGDRVERLAEPVLVDVVLVLSDADRLRLDLHELCQRVLQAPRNRHCTAKRNVKLRELPGRKRRGE